MILPPPCLTAGGVQARSGQYLRLVLSRPTHSQIQKWETEQIYRNNHLFYPKYEMGKLLSQSERSADQCCLFQSGPEAKSSRVDD